MQGDGPRGVLVTPAQAVRDRDVRGRAALRPWWYRYRWAVFGAVLGALLRLPFLGDPLSPDEAGFSIVATHWQPGRYLYGPYWVDRPPMLLTLFRLGAWDPPYGLRVLGVAASRWPSWPSASSLTRLPATAPNAGLPSSPPSRSPARSWGRSWSTASCWPLPSSRVSLLASVQALRTEGSRSSVLAAAGGVSAVVAVFVKQNMIDGAVFFAAVLGLLVLAGVSWRRVVAARCRLGVGRRRRCRGCPAVGRLARIACRRRVVRDVSVPAREGRPDPGLDRPRQAPRARTPRRARAGDLDAGLRRRAGRPARAAPQVLVGGHRRGTALLAVVAYDLVSVAAGGDYWTHYLVQLVVPTSLAVGIVAAQLGGGWARFAVAPCLVLALVWAVTLVVPRHQVGTTVGTALARVAAPDDTVVSALGDADVVAASGMASPYPYLWSLPARKPRPRVPDARAPARRC